MFFYWHFRKPFVRSAGKLKYAILRGQWNAVPFLMPKIKRGDPLPMPNEGFILQIIVYLVSLGATAGSVIWRIKELEKKVDKHNGLVERMVKVEQSLRSAHHRIDELKGGL